MTPPPARQPKLKGWLTLTAEHHLIPWLKRVSDKIGLSYSAVSMKQQQTRWGSCSSRRLISLNARLLFSPPEVGYLRAGTRVVSHEALNLNSEIELRIMRHFLLAGQISEKLAEANVRGW